jgi:hypothetical protein
MASHANILPVYLRLRHLGRSLNHKLVDTLNKEDLEEGGRRLGLLRGRTMYFETEDETSVLMDFCIYNIQRDGRNAVQRYVETSSPRPGSDEATLLDAMQRAYYSIVQIIGLERGVGVVVRDTLRGDEGFLCDVGYGNTASRNALLAGRILPFDGFLTTGGASLPVNGAAAKRLGQGLDRLFDESTDFTRLTPDQEADLAAMVIRACRETGASSQIIYATPPGKSSRGRNPDIGPARVRANRNDPCPCGSGRKYKSCCGKR